MLIIMNPKRRRLSSSKPSLTKNPEPDWSELQPELLQLILSKLSFIQILRFKAVCSSWHSVANYFLSSSYFTPFSRPPLLLLPANQEQHDSDTRCLFSLEDQKKYYIKNIGKKLGEDSWCIGSSHGWLVVLDNEAIPFLLNPFSQSQIQLPLLDFSKFGVRKSYFIDYLRKVSITKAVLLSAPSNNNYNNYNTVVLMYGYRSTRLAFCKIGDSAWSTVLDGVSNNNQDYCDIICFNDLVYALTVNISIEVWDFSASLPRKKSVIHASIPRTMTEAIETYRGSHFSRSYLVESCGEILFIIRFIGNFVNQEGEVVDEEYLLSDADTQPLVCPYRTKNFHVYKLDGREQKWVEVESLKNQALFIGDDNWEQMNEDYLYGGHDLGKFNLEEKIVKPFCEFDDLDESKIDPPPFWIFPNPW
ncbi:hypothetical protein JCGZ_12886 [Jatropha curcas]|uniref:F-box domain-containing protein n=1 Tax=Jatropha curcas TaxID=180498 RepID=A0A067KB34_JATCU|nr:hypothetical protein JCGZ_12886 [Jatropha curcas]